MAIGAITTWSDYIVGVFKLRHPDVYCIDDVGGLIFGRIGYVIMGTFFCLCKSHVGSKSRTTPVLTCAVWIFVAGSGMLGISICFNALSLHGACTAIFVAVAAAIGFLGSSIQTLGRISWLAWVGVIGILVAGKWYLSSNLSQNPSVNIL